MVIPANQLTPARSLAGLKNNVIVSLLVFYSIIPGISKLLQVKSLFALNAPIIFLLLLLIASSIRIKAFDLPFLAFFILSILHTICALIFFPANSVQFFTGFYIFTFPCLGYFVGKAIEETGTLQKFLIIVGMVHGVLGVILYPFFPYHEYVKDVYDIINEAPMYGRMGSVSGSLNFGVVMILAFVAMFFKQNKQFKDYFVLTFFLLCVFFSLQRSAWIGIVITILFGALYSGKVRVSYRMFFSIMFFFVLGGLLVYQFFQSDIETELFFDRFSQFGSGAVNERSDLWENGFNNFMNNPIGYGVGTAGQVARVEEIATSKVLFVPDGDFFKILSELGFISFLFFPFLFSILGFILLSKTSPEARLLPVVAMLSVVLFQMIGSNVSEFYFVNFVFWLICGFFFKKIAVSR